MSTDIDEPAGRGKFQTVRARAEKLKNEASGDEDDDGGKKDQKEGQRETILAQGRPMRPPL